MKYKLYEDFGIGIKSPIVVIPDNISNLNTYEKLNIMTNHNWSYTIDNIFNNELSIGVVITLFIEGRMMSGASSNTSLETAIKDAISNAYEMMFSKGKDNNVITDKEDKIDTSKENKEEVNEFTNFTTCEYEGDKQDDQYMTIDEMEDNKQSIVANDNDDETENSDDDECPISGSDITNRQIRFMNDFKDRNNIDTDEKFDYYVKTWASNVAVDNINTKKELIQSGFDMLENFIKWIKVMQPTLDKGIESPI